MSFGEYVAMVFIDRSSHRDGVDLGAGTPDWREDLRRLAARGLVRIRAGRASLTPAGKVAVRWNGRTGGQHE